MRILAALCAVWLSLSSGGPARAESVQWKRHILTETRRDHRTLLLVIDEAIGAKLLPRVILRRSFAANENAELQAAIKRVQYERSSQLLDLVPTDNPLWPIDHGWSDQDEAEYSAWVKSVANEDFLVGSGVEVDCADYALALRWIYSHDHHLPAGDQLAATGQLFGSWQSTTAWDQLPTDSDWKKDARFKAALRHLLNATFTHSIFQDLYPVAIQPEFVNPGTIYLTLETESGHTRTIFSVGKNIRCGDSPDADCILIIWGNEPAAEEGYITDLVPVKLAASEGGFLRFRWPEQTAAGWRLKPALEMRGYSEEQYGWDDVDYLTNVAARLHLWQSPEARAKIAANNSFELLQARVNVTAIGFIMCSLVPCTPQDSIYVNYSTPVRDHAIAKSIHNFQLAAAQVDPNGAAMDEIKSSTDYPLFAGSPLTGFAILTGNQNLRFNSDPSADFFARWGLSSVSNDDKVLSYFQIAMQGWIGTRATAVSKAQALCFKSGDTVPSCDPNDPRVKALSTDRLDQGLRKLRAIFLATYRLASPGMQNAVTQYAKNYATAETYCDGGQCSMYDFLLGPVDHWAVMTSNADSPRRQRAGF